MLANVFLGVYFPVIKPLGNSTHHFTFTFTATLFPGNSGRFPSVLTGAAEEILSLPLSR